MKTLLIAFSLLLTTSLYAQEDSKPQITQPDFTAQEQIWNEEQQIFTFVGNVDFQLGLLTVEQADKVVYNVRSGEIIVTGGTGFEFDGAVVITDKAEKKIVKYTLGESIAYLE